MNIGTNQLRLRLAMPDQVLMIGRATPINLSEKNLNVEIVVYRKDFDAGTIVSPLTGQADFGEYRVRKLFPEDCFVTVDGSSEISSAGIGLENIAGKGATVFRPERTTENYLVLVVWKDSVKYNNTPIGGHFRKEATRVLEGLSLAFTD